MRKVIIMYSNIIKRSLLRTYLEQDFSETGLLLSAVNKLLDFEKKIDVDYFNSFQEIVLPKGTNLLEQSKLVNSIWFVLDGIVRVYDYVEQGEERTISFFFTDDFIDVYSCCSLQVPSNVNVELLTETRLFKINWIELNRLMSKYPLLSEIEKVMVSSILNNYKNRIMQFQQYSATERYEYLIKLHPNILESVPLSYLASYLGISRERLSRIRKSLK